MNDREAFEEWFKSHYIKTGFVYSKEEMETAWQACAARYEKVMRRAAYDAIRWYIHRDLPATNPNAEEEAIDDIIKRAREGTP